MNFEGPDYSKTIRMKGSLEEVIRKKLDTNGMPKSETRKKAEELFVGNKIEPENKMGTENTRMNKKRINDRIIRRRAA